MWLMATKGRVDSVNRMIACMQACGDVPPFAVMVDHHRGMEAYRGIAWPSHWVVHYATEPMELTAAINALLQLHSDCDWYGVIADHARPATPNWSNILIDAAAGGYANASIDVLRTPRNPRTGLPRMASGVFDARIVKAAGFVFIPDFLHFWSDDVWEEVLHPLGLWRQTNVQIKSAKNGSEPAAPDDVVPKHARTIRGIDVSAHDKAARSAWVSANKSEALAIKIREAMQC